MAATPASVAAYAGRPEECSAVLTAPADLAAGHHVIKAGSARRDASSEQRLAKRLGARRRDNGHKIVSRAEKGVRIDYLGRFTSHENPERAAAWKGKIPDLLVGGG